jgi:hypothetical protein
LREREEGREGGSEREREREREFEGKRLISVVSNTLATR